MRYQNLDISGDKFFVKDDDISTRKYLPDLIKEPLARDIYFSPSRSPLLDLYDSHKGTCFSGWIIPTPSYIFINDDVTTLEKNLMVDAYTESLYQRIDQRITEIYDRHESVTLSYSGGIDSIVLLSFIKRLNLLKRTDIIVYENLTQTHESCIHIDPYKKDCINHVLDLMKNQVRDIRWLDINIAEVAETFNKGTLDHMCCYTTATLLKHAQTDACMFGWHGNQILLHKFIHLDEMICQRPSAREEIKNYLRQDHDFYTDSLQQYDTAGEKLSIERRYLLQKPWPSLDGYNGKIVYGPLADDTDMLNMRRLQYDGITVDMITDALLAREFIHRNIGDVFDGFITKETINDADSLHPMVIPIELLDPKSLFVPRDLNHDPGGKQWLEQEIQRGWDTGSMPLNSLVSIKNLQRLSKIRAVDQ